MVIVALLLTLPSCTRAGFSAEEVQFLWDGSGGSDTSTPADSRTDGSLSLQDVSSEGALLVDQGLEAAADDGGTVYYFSYPGLSASDFDTPYTDSWASDNNALCNTIDSNSESVAVLKPGLIAATDYVVETRFSVASTAAPGNNWADSGLAFRVETASRTGSDLYQCLVDLESRRVVIGILRNGSWTEFGASGRDSVPATGPYRLRATAIGSQLTCELIPGPSLQVTDSRLSGSSCGFTVDYAATCFDYLLVTAP